jgi:hypothetical protein
MPFAPFYEKFGALAARETRTLTFLTDGDVPAGSYNFVEMFCDERGCDCRRTFIRVYDEAKLKGPRLPKPLATISWGWENEAFYRSWASFPLDDNMLDELMGPALVTGAYQSRYADAFVRHFESLLVDEKYADRIVRHYRMFREKIDGKAPKTARTTEQRATEQRATDEPRLSDIERLLKATPRPKQARNAPCWCGSGKKYKKCHLDEDLKSS